MRRTLAPVAAVAAALLLASCTHSNAKPLATGPGSPSALPSAVSTADPTGRYVALGDSYSAGPLIPTTDLAGGCARSDHNYPSLVADELNVKEFVDVTCSGATTRDITHVQPTFGDARIPPQIRKVTRGTSLVTIGIGGNDLDLFGTLVQSCTRLRSSDPTGAPCTERLARNGPRVPDVVRTISASVAGVLRLIHQRAPDAQVVVVGYPRIVPDTGTCKAMSLATGDYALGRRINRSLDRALHIAAERTSSTYVDMYAASRGHDVCSKDPWVNGIVTQRQRALAFHPFAAGMRADADAVLAAVRR